MLAGYKYPSKQYQNDDADGSPLIVVRRFGFYCWPLRSRSRIQSRSCDSQQPVSAIVPGRETGTDTGTETKAKTGDCYQCRFNRTYKQPRGMPCINVPKLDKHGANAIDGAHTAAQLPSCPAKPHTHPYTHKHPYPYTLKNTHTSCPIPRSPFRGVFFSVLCASFSHFVTDASRTVIQSLSQFFFSFLLS